jgi:hypothetical protein
MRPRLLSAKPRYIQDDTHTSEAREMSRDDLIWT